MKFLENRIPPPLVMVPFGSGMWGIQRITSTLSTGAPGIAVTYLTVGVFLVVGLFFSISGVVSFRQAKTTVNPLKPESATSLVTSGIYQHSRNPMYVGFVLYLCAWAAYLNSIWSIGLIVLFATYLHRFQILPEEKALERIFGQDFINYKGQVRAWL